MGSNQSTANLAAVGAAVAALVVWGLHLVVPAEAMHTFPEAPAGVLLTWLFCRYCPAGIDPMHEGGAQK